MRRHVLALTLAGLASPMFAEAPSEPSPAQIRRVAEACTAQGAFGHRFGESQIGLITVKVGPQWTPFRNLTIRATPQTHQTYQIEAEAIIGKQSDPTDKNWARAERIRKTLKSEIAASHRFAHYDASMDNYQSADDWHSGYSLSIEAHENQIILTCTDEKLREQADHE